MPAVALFVFWINIAAAKLFGGWLRQVLYARQSAIIERLGVGEPRPFTPTLVIRAAMDEAAAWLRLSYVLTRFPKLANWTAALVLWCAGAVMIIYIVSVGREVSLELIYVTWFKVALGAMATFGLIILSVLLVRSNPFFFGWEGLFDGLLVDLNIATAPSFPAVEKEVRLPHRYWGRHSALYGNDELIELLLDWVTVIDTVKTDASALR
jgi:hypothetical protein